MRRVDRGVRGLALCASVLVVSVGATVRAERPAAVADVCARLAADAERLRRAPARGSRLALADVGFCHDGPGDTAWATRLTSVRLPTLENEFRLQARLELLHVDREGNIVARELPSVWEAEDGKAQIAFVLQAGTQTRVMKLEVFDYDGDGEAEVFAGVEEEPETSSGDHRAALYAFLGGKVVPSPLAQHTRLDGVKDVDGDGRPDLIYAGPYRGQVRACRSYEGSHTYVAPKLLLHSLPSGAFSPDDRVARRFAETSCAKMGSFALQPERPVDDDFNAAMVVCARLRGVSADTIANALLASYPPKRVDDEVCDDPSTLVRWTKASPPLSLAPLRH